MDHEPTIQQIDDYMDHVAELMRRHDVGSADDLPPDVLKRLDPEHPEVTAMLEEELALADDFFKKKGKGKDLWTRRQTRASLAKWFESMAEVMEAQKGE